jgi:hypothetical protein
MIMKSFQDLTRVNLSNWDLQFASKVDVSANNSSGITINFKAQKEEAILNGILIKKSVDVCTS